MKEFSYIFSLICVSVEIKISLNFDYFFKFKKKEKICISFVKPIQCTVRFLNQEIKIQLNFTKKEWLPKVTDLSCLYRNSAKSPLNSVRILKYLSLEYLDIGAQDFSLV